MPAKWLAIVLALIGVPTALAEISSLQQTAHAPGSPTTAAHSWPGADGTPLPFKTDDEVLEFLRTAKVVKLQAVPRGISHPSRVLLEKDGVRLYGHFNDVNEEKQVVQLRTGPVMNFRDSHIFQCAAFELARLLGLDSVPPAVPRYIDGRTGSLSLWIENTFTERDRMARNLVPPDPSRWAQQVALMHVWDNLVYNFDRTQENMLIGPDWKLWMIDHTRAFRRDDRLKDEKELDRIERRFWENLKALEAGAVRSRLKPFLRKAEIDALLKRREKLIVHFQRLLQERGEGAVLVIAR